jgi:uncharacterized protein (TIGR02444 family)
MSDAEDFWNYALSVYERARESCLALQDDFGFEVNLLLFCCWRGSRDDVLDAARLNRIINACADWRANVVEPLRSARRWLKTRADPKGSEALRSAILASELHGERLLQGLIVSAAAPLAGRQTVDPVRARRIAEENLMLYHGVLEIEGERNAAPQIQALLSGAFAEGADTGIVSTSDGADGAPKQP